MLSDDELARPAFESVSSGESASAAWETTMAVEISGYRAAEDAHFSARAADLEDIRDRVLGHLAPAADGAPIPSGSVVVAADLPLSRFLGIDWEKGGAIVLTEGSPTSHVAMLARARRVPMVVGLGAAADSMAGREALVDAASGEVVLDPTEDTRTAFAAQGRPRRGRSRRCRGLPSAAGGHEGRNRDLREPQRRQRRRARGGSIPRFATVLASCARN